MNLRRLSKLWFAYLLTALLLLTGCGGGGQEPTRSLEEEEPPFNVSLANADETKVYFSKRPKEIVSFLPSVVDTLVALEADVTIVAADSLEQVLELNPDLVVVGVAQNKEEHALLDEIKQTKIQVLVVDDTSSFAAIFTMMRNLGRLTEREEKAAEMETELKTTFDEISMKAKQTNLNLTKRVWMEMTPEPEVITAGQGTYLSEILYYIGAVNIGEKATGFGTVPEDEVLYSDPQLIILTYSGKDNVSKILQRSGWGNASAIRNQEVVQLDSHYFAHPGPQLSEGIKVLAKTIYPDVFDDKN